MQFNKQQLEDKFQEIYNKLNAAQRKAVDTIDGQVMVIAGPGTGKTQILSARIGNILLKTDYLPQNILCLTYTDAGVLAMRKRLLGMIGPEAYNVNLHSFHSFCNMVIQQNMHLFHKRELQPINDLEQTQSLIELIDGFTNDNPLKRYKSDAYYQAPHLRNLFSAMKREGWTVDFLHKKIEEYSNEIIPEKYARKRPKPGDKPLTQEGYKELERMQNLQAAVAAFPLYQNILKESHRYDFDDMITWVINAFETNENLLAEYQEQYQYILVDEYQDTSGSQNRLVELLTDYEQPNVFVVGDDDQSIYRFQGANLENMMDLSRRFEKDLMRVVLTQNYRSVQPVLDAAQSLIINNQQRLVNQYNDLEKILTASNSSLIGLNIKPEIKELNNEFDENIYLTEEIKKLVNDGIPPGKIAVIYREHKTGDELQKFFQLQNIPFYVKKSINLLHDSFIKKIINILKYIDAETRIPFSGEPYLFELLHYEFYEIPPFRIAEITTGVSTNKKEGAPKSLRAYLSQMAAERQAQLFENNDFKTQFVNVHNTLELLIKESMNKPLLEFITELINEAGILAYIMRQNTKGDYMKLLNAFYNYIKDEARRNPDISLHELLHQIELLEENALPLALPQTTGNETGVNLLTCHGSKGLEFEYVFLINAASSVWEKKKSPGGGFKLPENVFNKETAEEKEEELRRLFFVAVTRAEKHLYISYHKFSNDGKQLEPSRFISELNPDDKLPIEEYKIDDELFATYSALRYGIVQQPVMEEADKTFINSLLENFKLNVSALNNYLDCPLKFYYNTLMRVPGEYSESAQFGSSMHEALNAYYRTMMNDAERKYPEKELLIGVFLNDIHNNRQAFKPESLQRFKDYGVQCLNALYETKFENAQPGDFIKTEVPMHAVVKGIPLKGFADAIQYWGNDIQITDFKTGSLEKSNKRYEFVSPGFEKKPQGGNYWRQAAFYKLLSDNADSAKPKNLKQIHFVFVEPNKENKFDTKSIVITPEDEEVLMEQIEDTWNKIQAHEFNTGCGKPDCDWCGFVKEHKLYKNLIEVEEMEEEE